MKRRFILGILMALSISITGCTKVENEINKEVIVIDEDTKETIEKNKNLALNLKFQGYVEFEEIVEKKSEQEHQLYYFLDDSLFRFTFIEIRENSMAQFGIKNIVKTEMRKLDLNSRNEDLTAGEWTELDIKGELVPGGFEFKNFKIISNDKVYKLLSDGNLSEVEAYNEAYSYFKELSFSEEVYNANLNTFPLDGFNNWGIVDEEKNQYFELTNTDKIEGIYENNFRVFEAEDEKVYIYTKKPAGEDFELIIGYLENNKFSNLFENENFTIINQDGRNLSYDSVIKNNDKILFPGIIDNVNGIWNYDTETKKLDLQVELEEKTKTYAIRISPDKGTLIIENYHDKNGMINSLARVNENLEIEVIIDIIEKGEFINYNKFSEDGKRLYLDYFDQEEKRTIYEIYEITN